MTVTRTQARFVILISRTSVFLIKKLSLVAR